MQVLITGAAGMLGQDVQGAAAAAGITAIALTSTDLDITDGLAVESAVRGARPDAVINCAGWTDVDGAESATDAALAVNGIGPGHLARAAAATGAWTIHVSSDYVFDGAKREPYVESDPTDPLSAYGSTKLAGEHSVAREAPDAHTIVRSSWLFGHGGQCFPATMLRKCAELDAVNVVDDQVGCPTFTAHLAKALVAFATDGAPLGLVHLAGDGGGCSWFEFARQIVALAELDCEVNSCTTADMPRAATRPPYSVLGSERRTEVAALPDWRRGIEEYLAAVGPTRPAVASP